MREKVFKHALSMGPGTIAWTPFFIGVCTKFNSQNSFSTDELHIIVKPRNLEICKHSSFF